MPLYEAALQLCGSLVKALSWWQHGPGAQSQLQKTMAVLNLNDLVSVFMSW